MNGQDWPSHPSYPRLAKDAESHQPPRRHRATIFQTCLGFLMSLPSLNLANSWQSLLRTPRGAGQSTEKTASESRFRRITLSHCGLTGLLVVAGSCMLVLGQPAQQPDGTSSRAAEADARARIPYQQLTPEAQAKLLAVMDRASLFRRLPAQMIDCDQDMFVFLARYPEVLVNIWEVMGITNVHTERKAPYVVHGSDGSGTQCQIELIYGTDQIHIYHGTGTYRGSMFQREVRGQCVCVLHSPPTLDQFGDPVLAGNMDVFLKVENLGADLLTRTLAPLVSRTADQNFVESSQFISELSRASLRSPDAVHRMASQLDKVDPEVRHGFQQTIDRAAARGKLYREQTDAMYGPAGEPGQDVDSRANGGATAWNNGPANRPRAVPTTTRQPPRPARVEPRRGIR